MLNYLKLINWLLGKKYHQTLSATLDQSGREVKGTLEVAKSYFPFLNQGYFKGFNGLKNDVQNVVGIHVKEIPFPKTVFGAYLSKSNDQKETIFINKELNPVFKLSTLAHEVSHSAVWRYYQKKDANLQLSLVRYRIHDFQKTLADKQELLADVVTAIGTYPSKDFKEKFIRGKKLKNQNKLGFMDYVRAFAHLRKHYPDVSKGFLFKKGMLLNIALIIHFLRLRMYLFNRFDL